MRSIRMTVAGLCACAVIAALSGGCGSSDDDKGETPKAACETYCTKEDACDPNTTVDDCLMYACNTLEKESAGCQNALKAFYQCMNKKSGDICMTTGCETLETAYHDACS